MSAFSSNIKSGGTKLSDFRKKQSEVKAEVGERIEKLDPALITCRKQTRSKNNPGMTPAALKELGANMKAEGQHEPCVVRPDPDKPGHFLMVAGERRWWGAKYENLRLDCVVREMTDEQARDAQISENIHREALTQLELAAILREDRELLGTLEKVAEKRGKSISWVSERIMFLETVEAGSHAGNAVLDGLTADISTVNELNRLERQNPEAAKSLVDQARENPDMNLRQAARSSLKQEKQKANDTTPVLSDLTGGGKSPSSESTRESEVQNPATTPAPSEVPSQHAVLESTARQLQHLSAELEKLSQWCKTHAMHFDAARGALDGIDQAQAGLSSAKNVLAALDQA
ncbi:ParB/RepB/Spo0J family partition protein [Chromobacterium vaccinii]|uniref:ParB/RepB/Spo0J family partition protein n=1 Tax=Chromobacterium vaccinii TaxID=1108595 RepID=UPI00345B3176